MITRTFQRRQTGKPRADLSKALDAARIPHREGHDFSTVCIDPKHLDKARPIAEQMGWKLERTAFEGD